MLFFSAALMCAVMFSYTSAFGDINHIAADKAESDVYIDFECETAEVFCAPGSFGDEVRAVARKLSELGIYDGVEDGVYTTRLSEAVMRFQRSRGISADGVCGPSTLVALGIYTPPVQLNYRVGMSGDFVMRINRALAEQGYLSRSLGDRYVYDIATADAVRCFQHTNGIAVTGICDNGVLVSLGLVGGVTSDADSASQSKVYAIAKFITACGIDDYAAQCAAAAVVYNRCAESGFPDGIFENLRILYSELKISVSNTDKRLNKNALDAANSAAQGYDLSGGALYIDKNRLTAGRSELLSIGKFIFSKACS
ncbi:MAG: peptidoglycan-binding protein [Eubacteriales bacterium]